MRSHKHQIHKKIHKKINKKNIKQAHLTQSKQKKHDLKKYKKELDRLINVKNMPGEEQMVQIKMTQAQKSAIYMALVHLVLIGTDNSIKMAKDYSKKVGMDYSNLENYFKTAKRARKVGSRRVRYRYKPRRSLLKKGANFVKKKIQNNKTHYKIPQLGDGEIGMSFRWE